MVSVTVWIALVLAVLLLGCSAFVSMSETAFFSLSPADLETLRQEENRRDRLVLRLLEKPQQLLATILVANNFVNIVITLLLAYTTSELFSFGSSKIIEFIVETVLITFLLLLFGEITPKIYATVEPLRISRFACGTLIFLEKLLYPVAILLVKSTSLVEHRMEHHGANLSMDELSQAVELTQIATEEEKDILEGITKFGNRQASDIMRPRLDIVDVDIRRNFKDVLHTVISSGYSRIPVYAGTSDKIKGILYSKDLLPHLDKPQNFRWQTLIRPAYFVPESKHRDDLLQEFQENKVHLAIVVDEYGGTAGLVTLEDILEEIVGEISDEYDEEEKQYTRLADNVFLFEGKTLLNDFYKIMDVDEEEFEKVSGEIETLAGLVLELKGDFPKRGEVVIYDRFEFEIVAMEKRRIKSIKVTVHNEE
ncbi:MAG: gliding motility-associated protein GldE [Paludibacteraceae bacterium]|nr:gliding motility-associated protein GldE [Paludibacteraceae bacterium]